MNETEQNKPQEQNTTTEKPVETSQKEKPNVEMMPVREAVIEFVQLQTRYNYLGLVGIAESFIIPLAMIKSLVFGYIAMVLFAFLFALFVIVSSARVRRVMMKHGLTTADLKKKGKE